VARAEDLSVKCSRSVGMNFQVERSQDESSGPVHPCVAICVGMLLIVIGPFFIWHTEGDYVKILQVLDDALKDVKEPCSAMCTNCDFSKVKDGDLIYLAGPFHNLKTLTDVRKEGGFNIKELEPAVSGQEAAAAYSWSIEMFQFEQDVDTSQSVTLKADECKAAAFGVVTGEAKSRVCCDSIDAPGRKKFERLYVGRTNDARCHPARKRTHAESFLQEIDDVGLQFGNSTEGVLPELDKRRRLRDGKPAEPDIHCSYPCKHWTGRWADREFPTKPSAWTWLPYDLLQIDEVQWIEGAPAGNIPRLPFTGAYSNVKGGPGVTGGVTLGGVTLQLFKPEAGDELFQTTSSAILDRAGGDAGLQALGKDPIQSTFETQYKIEYRGYRRAAKWTSRETSYSRSDTCLVSSPMATGNLAAPQGGDLRICFKRSAASKVSVLAGVKKDGDSISLIVSDTHLRAKTGMRSNRQGYRVRQNQILSLAELVNEEKKFNERWLYFGRIVGPMILWAAFYCFLSPLIWVVDQFGDTLKGIPCIGGLLGFLADFVETLVTCLVCMVSCSLGVACGLLGMAMAWLFFRPAYGVALLSVSLCLFAAVFAFGSNQKGQKSVRRRSARQPDIGAQSVEMNATRVQPAAFAQAAVMPAAVVQPAVAAPAAFQVQCPAGVGPGTPVTVTTPDGRQVTVQIPAGVAPGQMFQVQA